MVLHTQQLKRAAESVIHVASSVIDSQSVLGTWLSEGNPELIPEDSASNVGPGKNAQKADDGIKQWLTGLKIDETKSEISLKGEAISEHNDVLQQGSNRSDSSVGRLPSLPGFPDATKPGNSSAEQDSLDRALIALSRANIVQNQSSMIAFLQDLVSNGVNLNAQDEEGLTAMHWASREGHLAFVKFLCERGADINLKSYRGQRALHEAIATGQTSVAIFLLKHEAADVEQDGNHSETPLLCAARHGRPAILDALLKSNADLDAKCKHGNTALHLTAREGHSDCTRLLLDVGAPIEGRNSNGHTALTVASIVGHGEVVELLLKAGARPNSKGSLEGSGPLQYAAESGHSDCTRLLLDAGASTEEGSAEGNTALILASCRGHGEIAELLLEAGAKVDARNDGRSSLMYATRFGHRDVVEILLAGGANIGARGKFGETVLFHVTKHPQDCGYSECSFCSGRETRKDMIKYLCKKGADVSAVDEHGDSLLKALRYSVSVDQDEKRELQKVLRRFGAK